MEIKQVGPFFVSIALIIALSVFATWWIMKPSQVLDKQSVYYSSKKGSVEERFKKNDTEHRAINSRLDKHAEAIGDLESQIQDLHTEKSEEGELKVAPRQKYAKGWDYIDFPENW